MAFKQPNLSPLILERFLGILGVAFQFYRNLGFHLVRWRVKVQQILSTRSWGSKPSLLSGFITIVGEVHISFDPARCVIEKYKKKSEQIQKIKKYHYGFFSIQNRLEKVEKEWKQKLLLCLVPARRVKGNCKKSEKIEKFYYGFFSSQNRLEKAEKEKK